MSSHCIYTIPLYLVYSPPILALRDFEKFLEGVLRSTIKCSANIVSFSSFWLVFQQDTFSANPGNRIFDTFSCSHQKWRQIVSCTFQTKKCCFAYIWLFIFKQVLVAYTVFVQCFFWFILVVRRGENQNLCEHFHVALLSGFLVSQPYPW